ncbi:MAG: cytochrome C oxidase subunit IV family protein [Bacteroidales bacterium]|nr:cytochrome C oxidase subunit IV family protein [Bacteroidales bacterium]
MSNEKHHISSFTSHAIVLLVLLLLTTITVVVAEINFGKLSIAVAIGVASIKATIVVTWFMHLKFENRFIKGVVIGVFVVYALVLIITFFDYGFRG